MAKPGYSLVVSVSCRSYSAKAFAVCGRQTRTFSTFKPVPIASEWSEYIQISERVYRNSNRYAKELESIEAGAVSRSRSMFLSRGDKCREEPKILYVYFFVSPSASTSDNFDISRYAGLSTDHIVSGMSSQEIAIATLPFFM